jgi:pilus assembly protein Flp/PilA
MQLVFLSPSAYQTTPFDADLDIEDAHRAVLLVEDWAITLDLLRTPVPGFGVSSFCCVAHNPSKRRIIMAALTRGIVKFLRKEDGPTAVEYAVMLALIIVVCITAIATLGSNANGTFTMVASTVSSS